MNHKGTAYWIFSNLMILITRSRAQDITRPLDSLTFPLPVIKSHYKEQLSEIPSLLISLTSFWILD